MKHQYEKITCVSCQGSGKAKTRAKAGSRAAVGKRYFATCPDCMGDGYHELRIKCDCQCPEPKSGAALVSEGCPIHGGDFRPVTSVM